MDIKAKLSGAQWRLHVERILHVDGEDVPIIIRRPPEGVLIDMLDKAKEAGEVDAGNKPVSDSAALRFLARCTALCLFAQGGLRTMFSASELDVVREAPWLMELQEDVMSALGHAKVLTEASKSFSEATPT